MKNKIFQHLTTHRKIRHRRRDYFWGKGKTFFHEKKSFSLPPNPHPFSKKAGYVCSRWSQTGDIKSSYPYSRSERFTFAAGKHFTLRSNASRRIYPALHVGLHAQTNTKVGYCRSVVAAERKNIYHSRTREASASRLLQANSSHCGAMLHAGFILHFTSSPPSFFKKKRGMFAPVGRKREI